MIDSDVSFKEALENGQNTNSDDSKDSDNSVRISEKVLFSNSDSDQE